MKRMLLLMLVAGLSQMALAAGSGPGNWRWKYNDGTPATANVGQGIVLFHGQDVIRLRMQFFSGSLVSSVANGHIFLQYCDAGPTTPTAAGQQSWSVIGTSPILNGASSGDGIVSFGSPAIGLQPVDGNKMPINRYSTAAYSSAYYTGTATGTPVAVWRTIADANIIHQNAKAETDSVGAAFIMANPDGNILDQGGNQYDLASSSYITNSDNITSANTNGILQLGGPPRTYNSLSLRHAAEAYYTQVNGNLIGNLSQNYYVSEFEFRFKAAVDNSVTPKIGNLQAGHRYFFRLRSWGSGTTTGVSGTNSGYSSPYGGSTSSARSGPGSSTDGQWVYSTASGGDGNTYSGVGDYCGLAPMPYLDVDAGIWSSQTLNVQYSKELTATVSNGSVLLSWATAQEVNNKLFAVQRSTDGVNYTTIGTVSSKAANGNSTAPLSYGYTDAAPAKGTNYYRLNQIDLDGTATLSRVVPATIGGGANTSELYPNPAGSYVNVSNIQVGSFYKIINSGGQVVGSGIATSTLQTIPVSNLASGVYFVQFSSQVEGTKTLKFLKK